MTIEALQVLYNLVDIIVATRTIHLINIYRVDGIQFQDIIVHTHQGIMDSLTVNHRRVTEHRDLGIGEILVAQTQRIIDNLRKLRIDRWFTIACESQHIRRRSVGQHILQFSLECLGHLLTTRHWFGGTMISVETTFTIDAVKRAHFAIGRQEIDTQRDAESTTMNRPENGRRIDDC